MADSNPSEDLNGNDALRERWPALWRQIGIPPERFPEVEPLLTAYETPGRHYHNLRHIRQCLSEWDSSMHAADDPLPVELAIWFHDAVYDPTRHDNEEQSAELMARALDKAGLPSQAIDRVRALILATKHTAPPVSGDEKLLVDIDLSILGQPAEEFDAYERAIRLEYQHVPADAFRAGRAAVLKKFLDRPRIYHTRMFENRYEEPARSNLQRSILRLRSS